MGQDNQEWSWVGEDGSEHAGDESELSFALSSEELPAHILVCRKGWGEWLPAMQVAELQWALPAGRADNPRKPTMGHRPKPPLELYPSLKKRARDIARGVVDPASESSLSLPVVTKPVAKSKLELERAHASFSASDLDEPTLQIDADALDFAFEQLQGQRDPQTEPGREPPPPVQPRQQVSSAERALSNEMPPEPTSPSAGSVPARPKMASKPKLNLLRKAKGRGAEGKAPSTSASAPTGPTKRVPSGAPPPPSSRGRSSPMDPTPPPPIPSRESTRSAQAAREVAPPAAAPTPPPAGSSQPAPATTARTAPPTGDSRVQPPMMAPTPAPAGSSAPPPMMAPTPAPAPAAAFDARPSLPSSTQLGVAPLVDAPIPRPSKPLWPWVALLLAGAIGLAYTLLGRSNRDDQAPLPVTSTPPPEQPLEPPRPVCTVTTTPVAVAGWAHIGVRPIFGRAPGERRVAVGYAQTSKLAVGLVLDVGTLNAEKPFSNYQNSPLLSVTPVTLAMGRELQFLESRAASTLQSAVYVPAKKPFILGQNKFGVAVRREGEADDVLWKPQWETINVPSTARVDADTHLVVLRAGGERGSILMAKVSEDGRAKGELQELAPGTTKLGLPTATTGRGRVVVAFEGAARATPDEQHVYLASWEGKELAGKAKAVLHFDEPVTSVGAVPLPEGAHLVQYTLGALTEQRVLAQVISKENKTLGEPITVSPKGKDAYNGELIQVGDKVVISYMVRSGSNHEFWASTLTCTVERSPRAK